MNKTKEEVDLLSNSVIGVAIKVHKVLRPGLLESAYEECVCCELSEAGIAFERQAPLPIMYKNIKLDCGYRMDIVVNKAIILELKSVESTLPIHEAQILTYLKLSNLKLGILLNFNVAYMKNGIRRYVNGF